LFTDPWLSPAADVATAVIPAQVEAVGPFDSLAPAMSIVETIVAAVNIQLADASRDRISRLEQLSRAPISEG
jgi:DNA-binding MurR/RpiR family transcriptional regulator